MIELHPVILHTLSQAGQILDIKILSWCVRAFAMETLGYPKDQCSWAAFCDFWPVLAKAEWARQQTIRDHGIDPHDAIDFLISRAESAIVDVSDTDDELDEELAERFRNAN